MQGFLSSFEPFIKKIRESKYKVEMALVGIALVVAVVSVGVFVEERRGMVARRTHAINIENKSV